MNPSDFHILLVEDDPINAFVVTETFSDYSITAVEDGMEALDKVSREDFHLVLMDINLQDPNWDGTRVMQAIREMPGKEDIPIFAVTSYALEHDRDFFLKAGFDEYIPKPLHEDNLGVLIEKVRTSYPE